MVRLILMDLDETLLRSDKTISKYSAGVLKRCQEAGILVGFCTARGEYNCQTFIRQIEPDCVISSGGALVRYRGQTVYSSTMTADEASALLSAAERLAPGCLISADALDRHYRNVCVPDHVVSSWGKIHYTDFVGFHQTVYRICMNLPSPALAQQIAETVEDCDTLPFSGESWYKFSKSGGTKENGTRQLGLALGIPPSDMIAFGDDFSDAGMLRLCGVGVAMGNAIESVRQVADAITDTNDRDGVARYLEEHILSRL